MQRGIRIAFMGAAWLLIGLCAACETKLPEIVQHDPPAFPTVDLKPFLDDGCQQDQYGYLTCPTGSLSAELECTYLLADEPVLGGLQPAYPIVKCQLGYDRFPSATVPFIYEEGCLDHRWVQYAIYADGQYTYLTSLADLQKVYSPVDSPQEALSYAVAATGLDPQYDIKTPEEYKYEVERIEETWVEQTSTGYRVHLFHYSTCGCGPHWFSSIVVDVARDGTIVQQAPVNLFRDPRLDEVCGD